MCEKFVDREREVAEAVSSCCIEEEELDSQRSDRKWCGYKVQRIRAVASWKSSWARLIGGTNS